jgi:hypothetical protein
MIGEQQLIEVVNNLSRSLLRVGVEASGFLESARWLLKPPEPLATQI